MSEQHNAQPQAESRDDARPLKPWHYFLLALPYAGLLVPPLYARSSPHILGMPFFYAYQFLWVFFSSGLTAIVYRRITR